jgi:DNA replication protein DnaC
MTEAPQILLRHHLKQLRLPTFQGEYAKQAQLCATENKDHIQYLARLCEMELIDRERRMIERRIKAAKFPSTKSLDSFDFKIMPSLNKPLTMDLARCDYVDRRANIIALGPSGTGKTHIALGLGLAACQKGLKVRFTTAAALVHDLIEAQDERRLQRLQKQLTSQNLLIIPSRQHALHAPAGQWMSWASFRSVNRARNCSLKSYLNATNAGPSSLPRTCPLMNGPRSSALSG